jgi:hypothetical protein
MKLDLATLRLLLARFYSRDAVTKTYTAQLRVQLSVLEFLLFLGVHYERS